MIVERVRASPHAQPELHTQACRRCSTELRTHHTITVLATRSGRVHETAPLRCSELGTASFNLGALLGNDVHHQLGRGAPVTILKDCDILGQK